MSKLIFPALLLFLISCGGPGYLDPEQVNSEILSPGVVIIDLRNEKKFADGHIKGAVNAEYHKATFLRDIKNLNKESRVILYCGEGVKSDKAAEDMKKNGFSDIRILKGGYTRWLNEGYKGEK